VKAIESRNGTFMKSQIATGKDPIVSFIDNYNGQWNSLLLESTKKIQEKRNILIATSISSYTHGSSLDRRLAIALTSRGHKVAFMLCDEQLKACQIIKFENAPPSKFLKMNSTPRCGKCAPQIAEKFEPIGLEIFKLDYERELSQRFENKVMSMSLEELKQIDFEGQNLWEHSRAGAIRYFATTNLEQEEFALEILRKYLVSAYRICLASKKIFERFQPNIVLAHHGIYVPQGIIVDYFRGRGAQIMTWTPSYREATFIFSPDESYHHSLITEPKTSWESYKLTVDECAKLDAYMTSRASGTQDWITFSDSRIEKKTNKVRDKGFFLALTSVSWDADLHYESRAFKDMKSWIRTTLDFFKENQDMKLVVRIHPAEVTSPNKSREKMEEYINGLGARELMNIEVVSAEDPQSTYELIENAKAVLIFNTKTGIEAAYRRKPVVVAGEAWIKGKGFSYDVYSPREYLDILARTRDNDLVMSDDMHEKAIKYAYHFFFKRMIRIELFSGKSAKEFFPERKISWSEMLGEDDVNFQEICNAILENRVPYSRVI